MEKSKKRYYRKHVDFLRLIQKIKLWPSRKGLLHGVVSVTVRGETAEIVTHCGERFTITCSRNGRAARWVRNKWFSGTCPRCRVPEWKREKYAQTVFSRNFGSRLEDVPSQSR